MLKNFCLRYILNDCFVSFHLPWIPHITYYGIYFQLLWDCSEGTLGLLWWFHRDILMVLLGTYWYFWYFLDIWSVTCMVAFVWLVFWLVDFVRLLVCLVSFLLLVELWCLVATIPFVHFSTGYWMLLPIWGTTGFYRLLQFTEG